MGSSPGSVRELFYLVPPSSCSSVIGTLLFFTILVFSCCYGHNHSTFQSIWYRAIRRQHRFQVNAMIRGASFPPVVPMPIPAMMPRPMPGYMPVPMHPEQMGGVPSQSQLGMAPHQQMVAPYPHPPPQLQPQVLQQVPSQVMKQPQQRIEQLHQSASSHGRRVEQSPAGFHSSRQHIISPHSAPAGPTFPAMFRNSQYQSPRAQAAANQARSPPAQMMPPGLRPDPRWAAMAEAPQSRQAQQPQQNRRGPLPMQGQGPMQQQQWIGGFPGPGQPPFPGRYPNNAPPEPRSLRPEPEGERRERGRR